MSLEIQGHEAYRAVAQPIPTPAEAPAQAPADNLPPLGLAGEAENLVLRGLGAEKGQLHAVLHDWSGGVAIDQQKHSASMRQIFGGSFDVARAEQFRGRALAGEFSWLPPVNFRHTTDLSGLRGAYHPAPDTKLALRG